MRILALCSFLIFANLTQASCNNFKRSKEEKRNGTRAPGEDIGRKHVLSGLSVQGRFPSIWEEWTPTQERAWRYVNSPSSIANVSSGWVTYTTDSVLEPNRGPCGIITVQVKKCGMECFKNRESHMRQIRPGVWFLMRIEEVGYGIGMFPIVPIRKRAFFDYHIHEAQKVVTCEATYDCDFSLSTWTRMLDTCRNLKISRVGK